MDDMPRDVRACAIMRTTTVGHGVTASLEPIEKEDKSKDG
jgi:hypothetical protein